MRKYSFNLQVIAGLFILAAVLTGCGRSTAAKAYVTETSAAASYDYAAAEEIYYENGYGVDTTAGAGISGTEAAVTEDELNSQGTKLIRNINVSMQTTEFDELYSGIKNKINSLGGYIENSDLYQDSYSKNRSADMTARIPQEKLDEFMNTAFDKATINSICENTEDVTLKYSDLEAKVASLETEQKRLLELMEKAEDIESVIAIEERLSDVRYQIDSIQSGLKNYDNRVTYSTVYIYINEVSVIKPVAEAGFGERISAGFKENTASLWETIQDIAVWFITNIFSIILILLIAFITVKVVIKIFSGGNKWKNRIKNNKNKEQ